MIDPIEQKFAGIIARKNTDSYINRKITLSFCFLMLIGITCGLAFFDSVYRKELCDTEYVVSFFRNLFEDCSTFSDCISMILKVSKSDIRTIFLIFISGFTYFCFPAAGVMVFSKGFVSGFTLFYLIEVFNRVDVKNSSLLFWIFVAVKLATGIISIHLATSSHVFSYKFREIKSNSSVLRRAPITYKYIFVLIYSIGGVLMINCAYCFLTYNFIK